MGLQHIHGSISSLEREKERERWGKRRKNEREREREGERERERERKGVKGVKGSEREPVMQTCGETQ